MDLAPGHAGRHFPPEGSAWLPFVTPWDSHKTRQFLAHILIAIWEHFGYILEPLFAQFFRFGASLFGTPILQQKVMQKQPPTSQNNQKSIGFISDFDSRRFQKNINKSIQI